MEKIWLTIIAAGVLTFLTRLSFFVLQDHWQPPQALQQALRYVPPAVLSAIIFPEILIRNGALDFSLQNYRLIAGLLAIAVGWRTRNIFLTIAAGMAMLYALQWIFH